MKYLITENQLKTLRKYMKTFINEANIPDSYITGNQGNQYAPWDQTDEPSQELIVRLNGKNIAILQINDGAIQTRFAKNLDQNIINDIDNKIMELYDNNMLDELSNYDDDIIDYKELMDL